MNLLITKGQWTFSFQFNATCLNEINAKLLRRRIFACYVMLWARFKSGRNAPMQTAATSILFNLLMATNLYSQSPSLIPTIFSRFFFIKNVAYLIEIVSFARHIFHSIRHHFSPCSRASTWKCEKKRRRMFNAYFHYGTQPEKAVQREKRQIHQWRAWYDLKSYHKACHWIVICYIFII